MPIRVVITPVIMTENGGRMPLVSSLVDPGRPAAQADDDDGNPITVPKNLVHLSAISGGQPGERNDDALSIVAGVDLSQLDTAAGVINLFEAGSDKAMAEFKDWLQSTPAELGWSTAKRTRIANRLQNVGANTTGIDANTPLWQIVNRLGAVWNSAFDVRAVRTMVTGA